MMYSWKTISKKYIPLWSHLRDLENKYNIDVDITEVMTEFAPKNEMELLSGLVFSAVEQINENFLDYLRDEHDFDESRLDSIRDYLSDNIWLNYIDTHNDVESVPGIFFSEEEQEKINVSDFIL